MERMYTIRSKRLVLHEIKTEDTQDIVKWRSDPQVYQYFKNPHALTVEEHLQWYEDNYLKHSDILHWMCFVNGVPAGLCGIKRINRESAEISYLLDKNFQHKGYAKEAVEAIIMWAREQWGLNVFLAEIHKDNIPSQLLVSSMGFINSQKTENFFIYKKTYI